MQSNITKNIIWVDIAKFIAMFLVVFEHVILAFKLQDTSYISYIRNIIVTFHMPLFFLIGGYLYKQKSKFENYQKILWSLLIPYLIYQLLYLPFKLGYYISYEHIPTIIAAIKCFIGILLGDNLGTTGSKYALSVCPALWFVMVMIQLRFMFTHINMSLKNLSLITVLTITSLKLLQIFQVDLYFCLDNTLYAIPYFTFGYYLKNYFKLELKLSKLNIFLLLLLFLLLLILCIYRSKFNNLLLLQYACGFIGSFCVILFSQIFNNTNKFVDTIAKNTLFIIFFHSLLLFISKWLKLYNLINYISLDVLKMLFIIFYSILIYIICYFVISTIEKLDWQILLGKYKRGKNA